ncbi:hypothetical protein LR48_Vigan05g216500 [Vigna angularis]|uniref:Uncharacterized protein n=1 Tax=Phaseolus angularis TaxID=3914 RepID=A0A0L9UNV3_PHAAN|nr:hypothetical protein LR48_Vigan05g216500 [Vigna angularis]
MVAGSRFEWCEMEKRGCVKEMTAMGGASRLLVHDEDGESGLDDERKTKMLP